MLIDVEHRVLVNGSVTSSLTSHVDSAKVLALITDDELMREAARRGMGLSQYARNPPSEDDVARSLPTGALKRVLEAREGTGERVDERGTVWSVGPWMRARVEYSMEALQMVVWFDCLTQMQTDQRVELRANMEEIAGSSVQYRVLTPGVP